MHSARVASIRGRGLAAVIALVPLVSPAAAKSRGELPPIKSSVDNAVATCATPGRLMAFTRSRNGNLDDRFQAIAVEYMRHGDALKVRWDFAYFQMLLETGNLAFKRGSKPGDVKPGQNNFAGIGATGNGAPGESFPDVSTGVKAHLEHLRLYAGDPVESPVAERTRKVAEWGVLKSWQKGMTRPVTFRDLATRWASNSSYATDIQSVANAFFEDHCDKPDPQPDLAAALKGGKPAPAKTADDDDKPSGKALAAEDAERGRKEGRRRTGLGAGGLAKQQLAKPENAETPDQDATTEQPRANAPAVSAVQKPAAPQVTILNPPAPQGPDAVAPQPAAAATATKPAQPALSGQVTTKCRVWTASYGGQRAIIIKSVTDQTINFTVLDVNEGKEKREAEAYIKAYAKGGEVMAEFASQGAALDKAFELCPEG